MAYFIALGILSLAGVVGTAWLIRTDGYGRIPTDPTRTPPRERDEPAAAATPCAVPQARAATPGAVPTPRALPTPRAATPAATTPIAVCPNGSRLA